MPDNKKIKKLNEWAGKKLKKTGQQPSKVEVERKKAKIDAKQTGGRRGMRSGVTNKSLKQNTAQKNAQSRSARSNQLRTNRKAQSQAESARGSRGATRQKAPNVNPEYDATHRQSSPGSQTDGWREREAAQRRRESPWPR